MVSLLDSDTGQNAEVVLQKKCSLVTFVLVLRVHVRRVAIF